MILTQYDISDNLRDKLIVLKTYGFVHAWRDNINGDEVKLYLQPLDLNRPNIWGPTKPTYDLAFIGLYETINGYMYSHTKFFSALTYE